MNDVDGGGEDNIGDSKINSILIEYNAIDRDTNTHHILRYNIKMNLDANSC